MIGIVAVILCIESKKQNVHTNCRPQDLVPLPALSSSTASPVCRQVWRVLGELSETSWTSLHFPLSGPVRNTPPPHHAIPFRDSIAEGVSHEFCLVSIWCRASIAEIPLLYTQSLHVEPLNPRAWDMGYRWDGLGSAQYGATKISPIFTRSSPATSPELLSLSLSLSLSISSQISRAIQMFPGNSPDLGREKEGVAQLKLPSGGFRARGGYRSNNITNRNLMSR